MAAANATALVVGGASAARGTEKRAHVPTHTCACRRIQGFAYTYTYIHIDTHSGARPRTQAQTHAYTHARTGAKSTPLARTALGGQRLHEHIP